MNPDPIAASRILILAPHPDDEIVACGLAASRAVAAGTRVSILYLTTGVPARDALWPWQRSGYVERLNRRRAEALDAAALLGLDAFRFCDWPSRRLREHLDGGREEVARALAETSADALWVPAFEGAHQDHDAANAISAGFRARLPIWEFAAYNFAGGRVNANRFPVEAGGEIVLRPTQAEAARKREALACYASERGNLRHIRVEREVCRPLPRYDYGRPPHTGRLFRERFHWVPFRHPRIDFAASAQVYAEIGRWASFGGGNRRAALGQGPGGKPGQPDRELAGALDETQGQRGLDR